MECVRLLLGRGVPVDAKSAVRRVRQRRLLPGAASCLRLRRSDAQGTSNPVASRHAAIAALRGMPTAAAALTVTTR